MSDSFVSVVFFEKTDAETKFRHEVPAAVIEHCADESIKAVCLQPDYAWSNLDKSQIRNSFEFRNVIVNGIEVEAKAEPFHQMIALEGSFDKYLQYWLITMPINEQTRKLTKLEWYPKSTCDSMVTEKYASHNGKVVQDDSWHMGICLIKNGMLVGFETMLANQIMLCNVKDKRRTDLF